MRIAVVGDTMLDVDLTGDAEPLSSHAPTPVLSTRSTRRRPGAAGLVATLLADEGIEVELVTALSDDARAEELTHMLAPLPRRPHGPISIRFARLRAPTPVKTRMRAGDHLLLRLHEDTDPPRFPPHSSRGMRDALSDVDAVIVSDYAGGIAADPGLRRTMSAIGGTVPIVWHPHPHGALPVTASALVTPNEWTARQAARAEADADPSDVAQALTAHWSVRAVAVTCGERGAVLHERGRHTHVIPTTPVAGAEAAGAGERFASAVAVALASGAGTREAVESAVAATRLYLADRGVAGPERAQRSLDSAVDVLDLTRKVRRHGGTVVATAGRFDTLDARHVRTLTAARALGDCLLVFINGDAAAGGPQGEGRPRMSVEDRRDLLMALECVDAVVVFDEVDAGAALDRIRPDVFVRGDDEDGQLVPDTPVVRGWGGRVVTVPHRPIAQAG